MAFTNNFRIERIYFEKLKSNIDILKSYIEAGATGEALELLKNSVDVDGAVLLLYRNLGEAWAELADLIQKTQKDLKDLAEKTEAYHDELNERIDDVNNYLMMLIRELEARLQIVEHDLATMNRNKYYDLVENEGSYLIEKDGETVYFDDIKEDVDFPHNVILRYDSGTGIVELEVREFTDSRIDFYLIGLADSDKTVKEILVSIDDTEDVTYSENTLENPLYTFGTGLSLDSNNELSVDFNTVQGKLTEGTGIDIDSNNEISVDTSVIQAKLTEGFGIDIDSNNEIKVDTNDVQEKLIAGQNITLTPDSTDPTKTVIDATGGSSYTAGTGIEITNDKIKTNLFDLWTNAITQISQTNIQKTASNVKIELSQYNGVFVSNTGSRWQNNYGNKTNGEIKLFYPNNTLPAPIDDTKSFVLMLSGEVYFKNITDSVYINLGTFEQIIATKLPSQNWYPSNCVIHFNGFNEMISRMAITKNYGFEINTRLFCFVDGVIKPYTDAVLSLWSASDIPALACRLSYY